ncbi:hypothetical protein [Micromonospora sp. NPDC005806]|uniref:hypothetical protein n=1 Tax=Micromonospora sp. NPDC005806 TaxID=3364234 RepID=UPI0036973404
MADSQDESQPEDRASVLARAQLADCDTKLGRHRAALEAGADPKIVTGWIAEVEAERRRALALLNEPKPRSVTRMSHEQITQLGQQLGDIAVALGEANPADRAEVYRQPGLRLTYHPATTESPRPGTACRGLSLGNESCPRGDVDRTSMVVIRHELALTP